jgi:hypothetical protein
MYGYFIDIGTKEKLDKANHEFEVHAVAPTRYIKHGKKSIPINP